MKKSLAVASAGMGLLGAATALSAAPLPVEKGMEVQVTGQAAVSVPNDEAEITFSAIEESKNAKTASDKVVTRTNSALDALKKSAFKDAILSMRTTGLSVNPRYTDGTAKAAPKIDGWEAVSRISVTVKGLMKMSDIMQVANQSMTYEGVAFRISRETKQRFESQLLTEATKDSVEKLNTIAKSLGLDEKHIKLVKLNAQSQASGGAVYDYAPMRMTKMENAMVGAAPQVESGDTQLTLRVSTEALILP